MRVPCQATPAVLGMKHLHSSLPIYTVEAPQIFHSVPHQLCSLQWLHMSIAQSQQAIFPSKPTFWPLSRWPTISTCGWYINMKLW